MIAALIHIFLLFVPTISAAPEFHPIHISKCQVEQSGDDRTLDIILHVFIDDLEMAMEQEGFGSSLKLGKSNEDRDADQMISDYISNHLLITSAEKTIPLEMIKKEKSDDGMAFWCFLRSKPLPDVTSLEVRYDLLMNLYDDQKNIFNFIRTDASEEYYLFRNKKSRFQVKL